MPTAKRVLVFRASLAQPVVWIEEGFTRVRVAFPSGQNGAAPVRFASRRSECTFDAIWRAASRAAYVDTLPGGPV